MVVKKVAAKKATKSSYKSLASYILDLKNDMEKVESYRFTNCSFTEIDHNILEIENMQYLNQRATQDKSYHLIVSFPEDENPSEEVLQDIEEELIKSLGLEDCQRLSVVHTNTNNKHIHIAINKIDPITLNLIDPFQDVPVLQKRAEELEKKHNLKITNHATKTTAERIKDIDDKTIHTGMINFKDWVKENAGADIKKVLADDKSTWKDLYETLAKYDLELRDRGNGNVISSRSQKLFIKATDISRDLSKAKLDKRYGQKDKEALRANIDKIEQVNKFGEQTVLKSKLWDEYREVQKQFSKNKKVKFADEKIRRVKLLELIKNKWQLQRDKIMKNKTISRLEKQKLYKMIKEAKEKEVNAERSNFKLERDTIFKENKKLSFKEFLIDRSLKGDQEALEALRKSKPKLIPGENTLAAGADKMNNQIFSFGDKTVNKDGTVTYNMSGNSKIIDKGNHLKISIDDNNSNEILTTLKMAMAKYGNELDITGTDEFKREILKTVSDNNLEVTFKDPEMQKVQAVQKESVELEKTKGNIRLAAESKISAVLEKREELEANKIIDVKVKAKALKENKLHFNRLYKLYIKTTTNATVYPGDLKKIGFEDKQLDQMVTYEVDIKVNGFLKNEINSDGLNAMNKKILEDLKKKVKENTPEELKDRKLEELKEMVIPKKLEKAIDSLERYGKFLYVFNETEKIKDMTSSYYDNRKIDVEEFTKEYKMKAEKLDKKAQAIKLDDKSNIKDIAAIIKDIKLTANQKEKVKFAIERARREEVEKKAINL